MKEEQFWWLSEFNHKPEVLGENYFPKRLKIYDTTLRDGEQTIGVSFDKNEKLEIAKMRTGKRLSLSSRPVSRLKSGDFAGLSKGISKPVPMWG